MLILGELFLELLMLWSVCLDVGSDVYNQEASGCSGCFRGAVLSRPRAHQHSV